MKIAHLKRFEQRWKGDSDFEKKLSLNESEELQKWGIKLCDNDLKKLYNKNCPINFRDCLPLKNPACEKIVKYKKSEKTKEQPQQIFPKNLKFKKWQERQIARSNLELKCSFPFCSYCIELSKGCSVQCWYCALNSEPFQGVFKYEPVIWNSVLKTLRNICGKKNGNRGLCYSATEPFDNPEYEKFIMDFKKVFEKYPNTTTAAAARNIERTREFLKTGVKTRFSVNSRKDLDILHKEFTAEELDAVTLLIMYNDKCFGKKLFGRARTNAMKTKKSSNILQKSGYENLCGFLINMVDMEIKLTVPAGPTEDDHVGVIVLGKEKFKTGDDFKYKIEKLINNNMIISLEDSHIVGFNPRMKLKVIKNGFQLSSIVNIVKIQDSEAIKYFAEKVSEGIYTAEHIIRNVKQKFNVPPTETSSILKDLFNKGALNELLLLPKDV
jgi:radical SAM family RiPP maturation amino acid epimerase